jgi:hypothetical protein
LYWRDPHLPFGGNSYAACDVAELQQSDRHHAKGKPYHGQISGGPPERRSFFE